MALDLQTFIDHIAHDKDNVGALTADTLDNSVAGTKYHTARGKANTFANVDAAGDFTGSKAGKVIDLDAELSTLKDYKKTAEKLGNDSYKKVIENAEDRLKKKAGAIFTDAGRSLEEHTLALEHLQEQQTSVMGKLDKRFDVQLKDLERQVKAMPAGSPAEIAAKELAHTTGIEKLNNNHRTAVEKATEHFKEATDHHMTATKELQKTIGKFEKATGLSAAEHMKTEGIVSIGSSVEKGVVGAKAYKELKFLGRTKADMVANWHDGVGGKLKTGIGSILAAGALFDGIKTAGNMMSSDPEKKEQAGLGRLVVDAALFAGSVGLARMGGSKIAAPGLAI